MHRVSKGRGNLVDTLLTSCADVQRDDVHSDRLDIATISRIHPKLVTVDRELRSNFEGQRQSSNSCGDE